jgi:hypothetical protein
MVRGLPAVVIVLTVLHWIVLGFRIPLFTKLPLWFWPFTDTPRGALWVAAALALLVVAALRAVLRPQGSVAIKLVMLVLLGYLIQHGFALIEGRGIDGIRDRMVYSGHAEFAVAAAAEESIFGVITRYDERAEADEFGNFGRSKPPGQLVIYMVTQRIANLLRPEASYIEKLEWLRTFSSLLWPLLSYLVIIPIYLFGKRMMEPRSALVACCLYVLMPSVTLMTLHTDQVFFPFFAMAAVLLFALAADKGSMLIGTVAGVWFYLALFCSFGFGAVLPLCAAALVVGQDGRATSGKRVVKLLAVATAGFILADVAFRLVFDYDIIARYRHAVAFHFASKYWKPRAEYILYFPFLSALEYAVWLGVPIVVFVFSALGHALRDIAQRQVRMPSVLAVAVFGVLVGLALFSRTGPESARIWMFLVPFVCLVVGEMVTRVPSQAGRLVPLVLVLQGVTVLLIKLNQDFG